jgi:hypothetical protein
MRSAWGRVLVVLVAVRVAIPLAALAAHGHALPGLPRYVYNPRPGDAYGYYSAVRELLVTWRSPVVLLAAFVLAALAATAAVRFRRLGRPAWAVVAVAYGLGAISTVLAIRMHSPGAPTIGWPLVWSVPLLPYRAVGLPLNPNVAFAVGLTLSLLANAVTVVMTAVLGRRVTGSATVGLGAAAGFALWPYLMGLLGGHRAWGNGTWPVDAGLHLYSEPLSTALVTTALVLCVDRRVTDSALAVAGSLLSLASVARLSNAAIAAVVLVAIAARLGVRRAVYLLAGLCAFLPVAAAYWSKGYAGLPGNGLPPHPFALRYVRIAWTDNLLWRPHVLLILLSVAAVGTLGVRDVWQRWLLWLVILGTGAFYSVYAVTDIHPRFLFVVLPPVLVLWCSGVAVLAARVARGS